MSEPDPVAALAKALHNPAPDAMCTGSQEHEDVARDVLSRLDGWHLVPAAPTSEREAEIRAEATRWHWEPCQRAIDDLLALLDAERAARLAAEAALQDGGALPRFPDPPSHDLRPLGECPGCGADRRHVNRCCPDCECALAEQDGGADDGRFTSTIPLRTYSERTGRGTTTPTSEREAWIRRSAQNLIDYPEILDLLALLDAERTRREAAEAALGDAEDRVAFVLFYTLNGWDGAMEHVPDSRVSIRQRWETMPADQQEHHRVKARAALRPAADPAGDLRERIERIEQGGVPAYGFEDDPADPAGGA